MTRHLRGWLACEVCGETAEVEMVVGESVYPVTTPEGWAVQGLLYPRDLCPRCLALNASDRERGPKGRARLPAEFIPPPRPMPLALLLTILLTSAAAIYAIWRGLLG